MNISRGVLFSIIFPRPSWKYMLLLNYLEYWRDHIKIWLKPSSETVEAMKPPIRTWKRRLFSLEKNSKLSFPSNVFLETLRQQIKAYAPVRPRPKHILSKYVDLFISFAAVFQSERSSTGWRMCFGVPKKEQRPFHFGDMGILTLSSFSVLLLEDIPVLGVGLIDWGKVQFSLAGNSTLRFNQARWWIMFGDWVIDLPRSFSRVNTFLVGIEVSLIS